MKPTRVAVFERMPLFLAGIVQVLNEEQGLEVVAEGDALINAAGGVPAADVIVVDVDLFAPVGTASTLGSLCARTKVVLMTLAVEEDRVRAAFAAGVRGYVLKGCRRQELVDAVRAAHRNEGYIAPSLAALFMRIQAPSTKSGATTKSVADLTFREGQIFKLLSIGLRNREIGRRLNLSEKSIKRYVTCIFEKLNVRNRVEAAVLANAENPGPAKAPPAIAGVESRNAWLAPPTAVLLSPNGNGLVAAACGSTGKSKHAGVRTTDNRRGASAASTSRYFHAVFGRTRLAPCLPSDESPAGHQSAGTHIVL